MAKSKEYTPAKSKSAQQSNHYTAEDYKQLGIDDEAQEAVEQIYLASEIARSIFGFTGPVPKSATLGVHVRVFGVVEECQELVIDQLTTAAKIAQKIFGSSEVQSTEDAFDVFDRVYPIDPADDSED